MRYLLFLLAGLIITPAVSAQEAPSALNWYVSGQLGSTMVDDGDTSASGTAIGTSDYRNAPSAALALGYRFDKGFRVEFEASTRTNDVGLANGGTTYRGDLFAYTMMVNGYYDFDFGHKTAPFIGAGLGLAHLEIDSSSPLGTVADEDLVFAYQVGAGVTVDINPRWDGILSYRYLATEDPSFQNASTTLDTEYSAQEIRAGFMYNF